MLVVGEGPAKFNADGNISVAMIARGDDVVHVGLQSIVCELSEMTDDDRKDQYELQKCHVENYCRDAEALGEEQMLKLGESYKKRGRAEERLKQFPALLKEIE